jgi:hypothetical protein
VGVVDPDNWSFGAGRAYAHRVHVRTLTRVRAELVEARVTALRQAQGTSSTRSGNMINRLRARSNSQLRTTDGAHSRANL